MSDPDPKRVRLEPSYPFVNYDSWIGGASLGDITVTLGSITPTATMECGVRPPTLWFQISQPGLLSLQCVSAQNSAVHHMHVDETFSSQQLPACMYLPELLLQSHEAFLASLPATVSHPCYGSALFKDAQILDVIASGIGRNPEQYLHVIGLPSFINSTGSSPAGTSQSSSLVVQRVVTDDGPSRSCTIWELSHRQQIVDAVLRGYEAVADTGDLIIPLRGLVLSVWLSGVVFRVSQLFYKITILRSALSPGWDDSIFLVAIGKRGMGKNVKRTLTLIKRLIDNENNGYSVPPACFMDPSFVTWLTSVNAQLVGERRDRYVPPAGYPSLESCAANLRIKKFLWPQTVVKIGVYFGTFDPVHANHLALARWAHEHCGVDRVVLVPNETGSYEVNGLTAKPNVSSLAHRMAMLELAVSEETTTWLSVSRPSGKTHRWEAKAAMAKTIADALTLESHCVAQPVLLLGADSWEQAVQKSSRDKTTRHFIGIAKLVNTDILVFPRSDNESTVGVPKPIRDRVKFVTDYHDPIEGLSSSSVRAALLLAEPPLGLHPAVVQYIREHALYSGP